MNTNDHPVCDRTDLVRDYAFDELAAAERRSVEQHLAQCSSCAAELDQIRLTTAALRVLPDREVPRRISFVSDRVFEPRSGFLSGFWNSAARLGFASACVLAVGLSFAAYHRQPEVRTIVQTADISKAALDEAVNRAVALAVDKAHAEDMQLTQAALSAVDAKYATKQRDLMVAVSENLNDIQKRMRQSNLRSYLDEPTGVRQ
jgi:anti-sigma factor RsiW